MPRQVTKLRERKNTKGKAIEGGGISNSDIIHHLGTPFPLADILAARVFSSITQPFQLFHPIHAKRKFSAVKVFFPLIIITTQVLPQQ